LFLAIHVLILDEPTKYTLKVKNDGEQESEHTVKKFMIGDSKGKQAQCFVEVDYNDPEDVEDANAWNAGDEMVLFCGKAFKHCKSHLNLLSAISLF